MTYHGVRAVALGLWRFGFGAVSFQDISLLYLLKTLSMFLVLWGDVLGGFYLGPVIL